MQFFADYNFFLWLAVLSIPAIVLGIAEKPIRYYGMLATAVMLWLMLGSNLRALGYMILFVLCEYAIMNVYLRIRTGENSSRVLYWFFLLLSLSPLTAYKLLGLTGNPHHVLAFIGISYMTFKVAQIIIEIYDGLIKEVSPFDFAYLLLFFPTILSGPIDRSHRFCKDLQRTISRAEYLELLGSGIYKILLGMVYKIVIAALLYFAISQLGMGRDAFSVIVYFYAYGFYLFFDFAGYSLMAIGAGYIFGIKVPDNFNRPFLSRNINEFWNRWHITLSHWLRDYVFSRITMACMRTKLRKKRTTVAIIAFMVNMTLMGCWHGLTSYYILYGIYHGVLLSCYEIVRRKPFYKKHAEKRWFTFLEWFITLHLVLFGFFIFSGRLNALT